MSGGSYGYVYNKIGEIEIRDTDTDHRRAAFQGLLILVAKAMKEIEWVDSGDCSHPKDYEAIDACFKFLGSNPEVVAKAGAFDALKAQLKEFLK